MTMEDAAAELSIGRTRMYALVKSGELRSVRIGRVRRVSADALREYVQSLEQGRVMTTTALPACTEMTCPHHGAANRDVAPARAQVHARPHRAAAGPGSPVPRTEGGMSARAIRKP
jgi:excisionase family DNA binding protein